MKVLGLNGTSVIVEMDNTEWMRIGGRTEGWHNVPNITSVPDVRQMADALRKIETAQPDLARIRASFKTFLMLTEPEAISEVLKACGVAEPVETIEEADLEE